MNRKIWISALLVLMVCVTCLKSEENKTLRPLYPDHTRHHQDIAKWLSSKPYRGDAQKFSKEEIEKAPIPEEIQEAANFYGVSYYALLRNEIIARHGYTFQNVHLKFFFSLASWYHPNPSFSFKQLSPIEIQNMNFIKSLEDIYDYETIGAWLDTEDHSDNTGVLHQFFVPEFIELSLNHLAVSPSRLLRNEIFARHGYIFNDPVLLRIFNSTKWYSKISNNLELIGPQLTANEKINLELCKLREWVDTLHAVKITLPPDVVAVPTIGYGAIYVRKVPRNGDDYFFSATDIYTVLSATAAVFNDHRTNVEALVPPSVIEKIKQEKDPYRKLVIFFENKKYKRYTDTVYFNHSDFAPPSYLRQALGQIDINYYSLLRKEIHARKGAKFLNTPVGKVFRQCRWYKERFPLVPSSPTRFPVEVKFSKAELHNFAVLEGEELQRLVQKHKEMKNIVVDLTGRVYWVKTGTVKIGNAELELGQGFTSKEEYERANLQEIVGKLEESTGAYVPVPDEEGC